MVIQKNTPFPPSFFPSVQSVPPVPPLARTDWTKRWSQVEVDAKSRGRVSGRRGQVSDVTATVMAP